MSFVQSALLARVPGLAHGFGTREEPLPEIVPGFASRLWPKRKPVWKQVHGTAVAEVRAPGQECGEVDALFALQPGLPLAVVTADCVPCVLARRTGGAVAVVHAGWRGTRARIVESCWRVLAARGESPKDWVAAIGPSIGPCCYEVSEALANEFSLEFAHYGKSLIVPSYRHLDLPAINQAQLIELGFEQVEVLRHCTLCSKNPEFHSYRRSPDQARQWSVALATPAELN
jgi:YfiH family protein